MDFWSWENHNSIASDSLGVRLITEDLESHLRTDEKGLLPETVRFTNYTLLNAPRAQIQRKEKKL